MAVTVEVHGADKLRRVADDLRQAGRKDLKWELTAGITAAVKPFGAAIHAQTRVLPSGYRATLNAALVVSPRILTGGEDAKVRVVVSAKGRRQGRDVASLNRGWLRHPTFGGDPWVSQAVTPGLVDTPRNALESKVVEECEAAVGRVADKLERG